ncbi:MAG: 2-C-methyl-D-erythritol 2,4-cyclodiphosphate synthase [Gemmatimonadetes bacterium]|nr:2-C-methyl-D-erythritol 2,4-cyclodiphosphate synthase [Gemmatimonadota bacterium]MBT8478929.1 2-C-methyl-D-erythritol 2,4-cyclodiphosphate synthase [Gemmatimonadota bacterium]NNK49266.1 2-C-methyl-D-erythritol 2,4-cyclodiphosphate synthase [Gemmatimonadota bacterium]
MRVGIGYDSHRFASGRPLVLGGVRVPDHDGLTGHSDGDAVAHALIDALLGASALGNIGEHFPDSDPRWEGADSMDLLAATIRLIEERNYQVVNADVTIITESPRIAPWVPQMAERIAELLRIAGSCVSVKGKTNEGMGWIGRGEGMATIAVVLLDQIGDIDTLHASIRTGG